MIEIIACARVIFAAMTVSWSRHKMTAFIKEATHTSNPMPRVIKGVQVGLVRPRKERMGQVMNMVLVFEKPPPKRSRYSPELRTAG
jgi:hypothetical protein